ncbi:MAG TPA: T9SS type A sorting domain-containing protein [bacterium]|nr:T9SS type A sorting domain-containing protein [bacterium]
MRIGAITGIAIALLLLPGPAQATVTFHRQWHWYTQDAGRSVAQLTDSGYVISGGLQESTSIFGVVLARTDYRGDTTSVKRILNLDANGGLSCRLSDGGYALLAESGAKILVRKYNASGDSVWEYRSAWGGQLSAFTPTFDGGCLVAGRIPDSSPYNMGAIKLSADGNQQWARHYHEPTMSMSWAFGAAQTSDSGYILCGEATNYSTTDVRLVRLKPGGDTVWTRLYNGPVGPMLNDVREMADSGFLAVGYMFDTLTGNRALYMLRTNSRGDTVWTRHVADTFAARQATAMCATRDGGFAIAGQIGWTDSTRAWLVKTNAQGDTVWTSVLPGSGDEVGVDVEQTADGGYVVAGTCDSAGTPDSLLLIKTDSLGHVTSGIAEGSRPSPDHIAFRVAPSPAGGIARIEYSLPGGASATLKMYDALGRQVFSSSALPSAVSDSHASSFVLRTSSFSPGVYLLRLESSRGSAERKLVIE